MIERINISKARTAVWLLVALTIPWQLGGKEPVAVLIDLILVALAGFLLVRSGEPASIELKKWAWLPAGLIGWASFSLVWSVNRYQTMLWLEVVGLSVLVFWLVASFGHIRHLRAEWLNGYLVVAALTALWGVIIYLTQSYDRLTSSFYLANPLAAFLMPAFLLSSWRYAKTGQRLSLVCAPVIGAALVLSDSRSAFLLLAAVVIVAGLYKLKLKQWLKLFAVTAAVLVLVGAVNLARTHVFHRAAIVQGARLGEVTKGESTSASDRLNYLKSTLAIWKDYPILGTGAGTFSSVHSKYQYRVISASSNAHNFYAQGLSELGVVGAVILAVILLGVGKLIFLSFRSKRGRAVALVLAAMLIHLALDIDAAYPSIMVVIGALAGLMVAQRGKTGSLKVWRNASTWAMGLALLGCVPAAGAYISRQQFELASVAKADGDFALAADQYLEARSGWNYDPDILTAEGIMRYTLGGLEKDQKKAREEYDQAKQLAIKAQYLDPYDAQHVFLSARVMAKERNLAGAEAAYKRTIELDKYNHPEYYADLAYMYLLNGQVDQVKMVATDLINKYPDSVVANRSIAPGVKGYLGALYYFRALAVSGTDANQAIKDARSSLKLEPSNKSAQELLNRLAGS